MPCFDCRVPRMSFSPYFYLFLLPFPSTYPPYLFFNPPFFHLSFHLRLLHLHYLPPLPLQLYLLLFESTHFSTPTKPLSSIFFSDKKPFLLLMILLRVEATLISQERQTKEPPLKRRHKGGNRRQMNQKTEKKRMLGSETSMFC